MNNRHVKTLTFTNVKGEPASYLSAYSIKVELRRVPLALENVYPNNSCIVS